MRMSIVGLRLGPALSLLLHVEYKSNCTGGDRPHTKATTAKIKTQQPWDSSISSVPWCASSLRSPVQIARWECLSGGGVLYFFQIQQRVRKSSTLACRISSHAPPSSLPVYDVDPLSRKSPLDNDYSLYFPRLLSNPSLWRPVCQIRKWKCDNGDRVRVHFAPTLIPSSL